MSRVVVRVPNWLGDSVMARPFVAALAQQHGVGQLLVVAHPRLADLWRAWPELEVLALETDGGRLRSLRRAVREIRRRGPFERGYLMTASLSSALMFAVAGVRERIGFAGDGRSWLLADPVPRVPQAGVMHYSSEYFNLIHRRVEPDYAAPPPYAWPAAAEQSVTQRLAASGLKPGTYVVAAVGTAGIAKRYPPDNWRRVPASRSQRAT